MKISEEDLPFVALSLTSVGPAKPIGYLPLYTLRAMGEAGERIVAASADRGLSVVEFGPDKSCVKSGAIYVYDRIALGRLLKMATATLAVAGLSSDPDEFVAAIAATWFSSTHPLTATIAAAFGDTAESKT